VSDDNDLVRKSPIFYPIKLVNQKFITNIRNWGTITG